MLGYKRGQVHKWERIAASLGFMILRRPPEDWPEVDSTLDFIMIFHYCWATKQYRFDRHFEILSRAEHFTCGGCHAFHKTHEVIGCLGLKIKESVILASEYPRLFFWPVFFRFLFFGLGKHTPQDRGGKTTGELEQEAVEWNGASLFRYLPYPKR